MENIETVDVVEPKLDAIVEAIEDIEGNPFEELAEALKGLGSVKLNQDECDIGAEGVKEPEATVH